MLWEIKHGDWIEVLRTMPDESVHCSFLARLLVELERPELGKENVSFLGEGGGQAFKVGGLCVCAVHTH